MIRRPRRAPSSPGVQLGLQIQHGLLTDGDESLLRTIEVGDYRQDQRKREGQRQLEAHTAGAALPDLNAIMPMAIAMSR